jgi:hypothetical protein
MAARLGDRPAMPFDQLGQRVIDRFDERVARGETVGRRPRKRAQAGVRALHGCERDERRLVTQQIPAAHERKRLREIGRTQSDLGAVDPVAHVARSQHDRLEPRCRGDLPFDRLHHRAGQCVIACGAFARVRADRVGRVGHHGVDRGNSRAIEQRQIGDARDAEASLQVRHRCEGPVERDRPIVRSRCFRMRCE